MNDSAKLTAIAAAPRPPSAAVAGNILDVDGVGSVAFTAVCAASGAPLGMLYGGMATAAALVSALESAAALCGNRQLLLLFALLRPPT